MAQDNSVNKVVFFVLGMCLVAALLIAVLRESTYGIAVKNEEIFNKRAVLASIEDALPLDEGETVADLADEAVLDIFSRSMDQVVLDADGQPIEGVLAEDIDTAKEKKKEDAEKRHPLFIYNGEEEKLYIVSLRGNGLWDEIWGYVALSSDLNTIFGAAFDHKGETPGLGAEIKDSPYFPERFKGKKIINDQGEYVSVLVQKGGADKGDFHAVDGISGATVTANGVTEMLYRGMQYYLPYFRSLQTQPTRVGMLAE